MKKGLKFEQHVELGDVLRKVETLLGSKSKLVFVNYNKTSKQVLGLLEIFDKISEYKSMMDEEDSSWKKNKRGQDIPAYYYTLSTLKDQF